MTSSTVAEPRRIFLLSATVGWKTGSLYPGFFIPLQFKCNFVSYAFVLNLKGKPTNWEDIDKLMDQALKQEPKRMDIYILYGRKRMEIFINAWF